MKGWDMFNKIHQLKNEKLKKTQVARLLHSDIRTIKKYWDMSPEQFEILRATNRQRIVGSKMESYHNVIVTWIKQYKDISASQIFDWLKEREPEFPFAERTVRDFVAKIRLKYDLPKPKVSRHFMATSETEPGEQAQVDMGQIKLFTKDKHIKKLYLFSMVLSFSRYKFAIWQDKPFSTEDIVNCHIKAFQFFGGVPKEVVYDQDKTMFVSENSGDILKTKLFQHYLNSMNFKVRLCRSYDPQSKGKVEAVIKYIKNNFAKNRIFTNIDEFNHLCLQWLERTGNKKVHGTIKKVPADLFLSEQNSLQQIPDLFALAQRDNTTNIVPYSIAKDNTVMYKSNRYQLPKGTYSDFQKEIGVYCNENKIFFYEITSKNFLYSYQLSTEKGKLISDFQYSYEIDSKTMNLRKDILEYFSYDDNIKFYLEKIETLKFRYIKPQFKKFKNFMVNYEKDNFKFAIKECITRDNYDLDFLLKILENKKKKDLPNEIEISVPEKLKGIVTINRNLSEYEEKLVINND